MDRINVTKTFLPPIDEYEVYVRQIWESSHLTNQGPLLHEFEKRTMASLGVDNFHFVSNGTIALQLALHALDITEGEVVTTPFSYVATTSAILWERCEPVYVDIDPDTLCIDADKIEAAITPKTRAIMAVHVFGNPCNVEKIEDIAVRNNLKVIYDAAHAFGVTYKGRSLLSYGDISTCSFHATKLFHTIEGGCVVAKDETVSQRVELLKRFGHEGDDHYMLGINAKATEFQAAMGLVNLRHIEDIIAKRKTVTEQYDVRLKGAVRRPSLRMHTNYNYSYYPIVLKDHKEAEVIIDELRKENIFPRRYFYPSLNKLPYTPNNRSVDVSEGIASRILCLPLHDSLDESVINKISDIIVKCVNK